MLPFGCRYSDGITSTDAFETSSPRFPIYHSASADVEGGYSIAHVTRLSKRYFSIPASLSLLISSILSLCSSHLFCLSGRYRHYLDYIHSAAEQGISPYGAGDEQREVVRTILYTT